MSRAGIVYLFAALLLITGCSSAPTCEELAFYEYAEGGRRIVTPDDLDPLDEYKEMVIPEASPRPPRDLSAGCLDKPPTLRTSADKRRAEEEAAAEAEANAEAEAEAEADAGSEAEVENQ
jgi:hypothetical protein